MAGAAAVAVVVVGGALAWSAFAGGASEAEQDAIAACEEILETRDAPPIMGGEVYTSPEWRDYYAVVETHGDAAVALEELDEESVARWEAAAQSYEDSGDGTIAVVWRFEDDSYLQCVVPVRAGEAAASAAAVGDLTIAAED